jgi:DNA adenine methylase
MWCKRINILDYINDHVTCRPVERPIMRYFGGKWKIAQWIISHFPAHKIYVEPFGGAASVLVQKPPVFREVYNDLNGDVINLFHVLQDRKAYADLRQKLKFTPFARGEYELGYEKTADPVERARRLLIKSWMSFGGAGDDRYMTGFRTNISQTDKDHAREWCNWLEVLPLFVERFRRVTIENAPANDVIKGHDSPDTLFYIDPPYSHGTRRRNRYSIEMSDGDHQELLQVLVELSGFVILSGYRSELYDRALADWPSFTKSTQSQSNAKRTEVLWLSPRTWAAISAERKSPNQLELAI